MRTLSHILLASFCTVLILAGCDERSVTPTSNGKYSSILFEENFPNGSDPKWRNAVWTYRVENHSTETTDIVQARIGERVQLRNGELADMWIYTCRSNPMLCDTQLVSIQNGTVKFYNAVYQQQSWHGTLFRSFPLHLSSGQTWNEPVWRVDSAFASNLFSMKEGVRIQGHWYEFNAGGSDITDIVPDVGIVRIAKQEFLWFVSVDQTWTLVRVDW